MNPCWHIETQEGVQANWKEGTCEHQNEYRAPNETPELSGLYQQEFVLLARTVAQWKGFAAIDFIQVTIQYHKTDKMVARAFARSNFLQEGKNMS